VLAGIKGVGATLKDIFGVRPNLLVVE